MEAAESAPTISVTEPLPPGLMFFISNFHHLIPIKLTEQNYAIWKLQCEGALKASSLFEYIQESQAPSPTTVDSTGNSIHNPMFYTWVVFDTHIRSCLIATLTPDVLTQVPHTSTARGLWMFLKQKFENSNSSGNLNLQPSSLLVCQIRSVESFQPANATMVSVSPSKTSQLASDYSANKVFDGSPNRDWVAIADGPDASAANTRSDTVHPTHGTAVLFEPEMSVLNQSDSRFGEDRLALSLEGCETRQESGTVEPFQQKSKPQISEVEERVILMTPEKNPSGSKRKAPTPPVDGASDPSSDSLKKNKTVCFSANCTPSAVNNDDIGLSPKETGNAVEHTRTTDVQQIPPADGASDPSSDSLKKNKTVCFSANCSLNAVDNDDIGLSPKETGNAVEHTRTTDVQQIPNSQNEELGGNSLPFHSRLNGDKAIVLVGTTDDQTIQNSQEVQVEGNSLEVYLQVNGGEAIVLEGTTDDPVTQNSPEIQVEGSSLQVDKQLNGGDATESTVPVRHGRWICWSRPPPGMVALHFDGSVRDGSAAGGGVFRDHDGQFIAAFSVHLGPGTSNEAEAKALQAGLLFARARCIPVNWIYGDSSMVVRAVNGTGSAPRKMRSCILAIRNLLSDVVIAHTNREGNMVADALAALGHCLPAGYLQSYLRQEELPESVSWHLSQDRLDFEHFRPPL